jgi:hypothetical protein
MSILVWWVVAGLVIAAAAFALSRGEARIRALQKTGTSATALVLDAEQTGSWVGNNPVMKIVLEVNMNGNAPVTVTVSRTVPVSAAAAIQPGAIVKVRLDPKRPHRLVFDEPWSKV